MQMTSLPFWFRIVSGLAVADDQLTLPSSDRDHGVDRLDARLKRLFYRLSFDDSVRPGLHGTELGSFDRACSVDRLSDRVHYAADHRLPDRDRDNAPCPLDRLSFTNAFVLTEQNRGNTGLLEVLRHAKGPVLKFEKFARHAVHQAAHPGDTVADGKDRSGLILYDRILIILDLTADHLGYLLWF